MGDFSEYFSEGGGREQPEFVTKEVSFLYALMDRGGNVSDDRMNGNAKIISFQYPSFGEEVSDREIPTVTVRVLFYDPIGSDCVITDIAVYPFQEERRGFGEKSIQCILDAAREAGFEEVRASQCSWTGGFWEKNGFVPDVERNDTVDYVYRCDSPEAECNFLKRQLETLKTAEGWEGMTSRQQAIMLASIRVQWRAERGSDEASRDAVIRDRNMHGYKMPVMVHTKELLGIREGTPLKISNRSIVSYDHDPESRGDRKYQDFVVQNTCIDAVCMLESELFIVKERRGSTAQVGRFVRENFVQLPYHALQNCWPGESEKRMGEIQSCLDDVAVPSVLLLADPMKKFTSERDFGIVRVCVYLGKDEDENPLFWGKWGKRSPFLLSDLKSIDSSFSYASHIAVRPLKNRGSGKE